MERLGEFGLGADLFVGRDRGAMQLESLVVAPSLDQAVTFLAEPVGFILPHTGFAREGDRGVEVTDRPVYIAEPEEAQRDVAMILAHRGLGLQALADGQCLLVVVESLAELAKKQMYAADVAKRVAHAAREIRLTVYLEHLLVLLERGLVITQLVVHETQIVEARALELPIADLATDRVSTAKGLLRLRIVAKVPFEQPEDIERLALGMTIATAAL